MKFGKKRKDGSVLCTIDENDEVLNSDTFFISALEDVIDSIPESKNLVKSDYPSRKILLPGRLLAKIQTVGFLIFLKSKMTEDLTLCRCDNKQKKIEGAANPNIIIKNKDEQNMDTVTLSFSKAKLAVRKAGIKNIQKYVALRTSKKLPTGLPADPKTAYARYWKGWTDFCGTQAK